MNYYVRYFDSEEVLSSPEALVEYVASIPQIIMTEELADAILKFCEDKTSFPRHFRLPNKNTFIVIKTNAETLEEFKTRGANGGSLTPQQPSDSDNLENKEVKVSPADEIKPGLYDVTMIFRRAIVNPETRKCSFVEETFRVEMLAQSQRQCFDVVIEHLKSHPDIDSRSQYPSIRSTNFKAVIVQE
ncbi:MAG: hypothetical protein IKU79_03985 [Bacteroidaceae bacterium]|jgi:hypothetical protein|nr:hypothetical protein [Bacteroidaceae bacterium]